MNDSAISIDHEGSVTLTSPDGNRTYLLLGTIQGHAYYNMPGTYVNCIESYTLTGGPQEPFEVLTLRVPKRKLTDISPDFEKANSIVAGKTRISVKYYGCCENMVVTKCRVTNDNYNITAYHECEIIRGLQTEGELTLDARSIIEYLIEILDEKLGYVNGKYAGAGTIWMYDTTLWSPSDVTNQSSKTGAKITVPAGTNAWFVLQTCAMMMGCRVFFAGAHIYIVDYRLPFKRSDFTDVSEIDLYSDDDSSIVHNALVASPQYGEEGFDTVVNSITIDGIETPFNSDYKADSITVSVPGSIRYFGQRNASAIDTHFLTVPQCLAFGETYLSYLSESQQSITMELKELSYDNTLYSTSMMARGVVWNPTFPVLSRIGTIKDTRSNITIDNTDIYGNIMPQKLYLSTYAHNYPKGTTEYTFGVMDNISLSQSTSQILTAVGGLLNFQ